MKHALLLVVAVVAAIAISFGTAMAGSWTRTTIFGPWDDDGYVATFDALGRPHIALSGFGLSYLDEGGWQPVVGSGANRREFFEAAISYGIDFGSSHVRIAWVDIEDPSALWLSRNDTGAWVSSRMSIGTAHKPAIAQLGQGLAVAFQDGDNNLRFLTWDPVAGPSSAQVVAARCCNGPPPISAHNGITQIAFSEAGRAPHRLRMATKRANGRWSVQTIDGAGTATPQLAIADADMPMVAYIKPGRGVWYALRGSRGWRFGQVVQHGKRPSVAADNQGRIEVVAQAGLTKIVFRRVDLPFPVQTIAHANGGWAVQEPTPYVGLAAGRAVITYAEGSYGVGEGCCRWALIQAGQH